MHDISLGPDLPATIVGYIERVSHIDIILPRPYSECMDYRHIITIEPDKRGGKPSILG